jgi:uncharacterized protein (TIGR02217 family)
MSFINFPSPTPVFPTLPSQAWSVHKKPILSSRVTTAVSGRSNRLACAAYPRWAFTLTFGGESAWLRDQTQNSVAQAPVGFTELQQISGLFMACLGAYGEFYFTDPDDSSRSNQSVGTGDGSTTTFPLYYSWGSGPLTPPLTFPVTGINTIDAVYFNGVLQSASLYSLDSTKTKLVFTSAPGAGVVITADFHFYFRCRFLDDKVSFSQWAQNLWDTKEVQFESVKV